MINETMAKRFWPNEDPIGQTISIQFYNDQPRQIVGIVPDIRPNLRNRDPEPQMYVPHTQLPTIQAGITAFGLESVTFVVRSIARIEDWLPGASAAAKEIDPAHAVNTVRLVSEFAAQQTQGFRQYVILLGVFSGIALLLAVVGIYGVMSHSVTQRTNEIGIRVAFGATSRDVLASVLGRGLIVIGIGMAVGLVASLSLTRIIDSALWGVTATDPYHVYRRPADTPGRRVPGVLRAGAARAQSGSARRDAAGVGRARVAQHRGDDRSHERSAHAGSGSRSRRLSNRTMREHAPGWTDHNEHDPGVTMLELIAYLAEDQAEQREGGRRRRTGAIAGDPRAGRLRPQTDRHVRTRAAELLPGPVLTADDLREEQE